MKSVKGNFVENIFRKAKISFLKIYYARGSAHEIALGAAIGAFWGVFPTFGLSTILIFLLYKIFRFNIVAAISGAFISNPLTSPFLLMISYKVGSYFIKTDIQIDYDNWYKNLPSIGYVLLIGSTIVSTITGLFIYYITKYVVDRRRNRKANNSIQKTK
ncbi:DUF2062 domain-containing protein [Flavobacterium sp.]|jgi:uncharacterized protein (DUF2062 family)|uniref:DUF2062 domain-containing protein n=1 Tax=Flavobacterium sp. TaxID=239 RepID=UPI0022BC94CB|nr:DUF2062 domain-containing protein [Flavobacterium sp.]MCZ8167889.1 DUF2062 domain-containing protein [Flavobacterium sp.]MCZ8297061.1 DUF2062 domain-containing protein [Flavobacterium sp.]